MRPTFKSQFYSNVRSGRVSSVDKDNHTVQVQFDEQDGFVSYDLQMLVPFGGDYVLPKKDTPVLCALTEGRLGDGFILGAYYTEADAPPLSDEGQRSIAGDDLRLGDPAANKKIALAPAVKDEIQKVLDFAKNIKSALDSAAAAVAMDGGAALWAPVKTALGLIVAPTINEPKAENVSAK